MSPGERGALELYFLPYPTGETEYDQLQQAYKKLQRGSVSVILGADIPIYSMAAEKLGIPLICTSLVERDIIGTVFYMMPKPTELCRALEEFMTKSDWRTVGVIYEETLDTSVLNHLVGKLDLDLKFGKIPMTANGELIKNVLLKFRNRDIINYLVMTSAQTVRDVLKQARQLGIVSIPNEWILLNLGSQDVSTNLFDDLRTNVTTLNFASTEAANKTFEGWDPLNQAILTDAITALAKTKTSDAGPGDLAERLNQISFFGETGHVIFNGTGWRMNLTLTFYTHTAEKFEESGHWYEGRLFTKEQNYLEIVTKYLKNSHLEGSTNVRVVTILEKPFCMLNPRHEELEGNERFSGFTVDMMEEIGKMIDFEYELYIVHDGKFGVEYETGKWNGIIGEILEQNATMSFAPLSINARRESVIDFTKPFKTRGITVLMKTPESQSSYFQFMKPLSGEVWVCTLVTMIVITVILFFYERYSLACRKDMPKLNLKESMWFIFGSLVQGSTESAPVTVPGRILTSAWWFFSLIMISTYTANLAAFLTVKKINPPISSVTDLAHQSKIKYGTVRNSGIEMFFRNTRIEPFATMWVQMSEIFTDALVNSTEEGLKKVKEGDYAFLWDSTVTSYIAATDCDYTEIGPSFDPKGFGMGVPSGAIYLEKLSMALLQLADKGTIAELEQKYWGESDCAEYDKPTTDETSELMLENAAGMFFVLFGGILLGLVALAIERFLRKTKIIKPKNKHPHHGIVDLRRA